VFVHVREHKAETAFDVAAKWSEAPRYGFLSDFAPGSGDGSEQADFLLRHHLNVVQFYDWMYRHDCLLTEEDPFTDPLGRTISLTAVRARIEALRERGIASFAYAAVYASLPDYAEAHPEQLLYRNDGTAYSLGNFFYIMDISPGSAWTEHVTDEFRRAIEWGFDGLHLDQYGFPKRANRRAPGGGSETVRLAEAYPALIDRAREKLPEAGLIFNNVGTYPAHATAEAGQDAVYIEVWDPVTRLRDVYALVRRTRALTRKPIILAAYLPPFHPERPAESDQAETGARVAMSVIFASGAYHLLLGENGGVLADPYYPKYGRASASFRERLARYSDFIVMYRDILFDPSLDDWTDAFTGGINNELVLRAADANVRFSTDASLGTVWTLAKEKKDAYVIHLINLVGLDNDVWHAPKERAPEPVRDIELSVEVVERIEAIFAASPDGESIRPLPLAWEWTRRGEDGGRFVRFTLPRLDDWTVVCIRLRGGVPAETE
jgi:dextranase